MLQEHHKMFSYYQGIGPKRLEQPQVQLFQDDRQSTGTFEYRIGV